MSDRVSRARAAFTSLLVVFVVAVGFMLLVAALILGIGSALGILFGGEGTLDEGPDATFDVVVAGNDVTITHEDGDAIAADELFVFVDREPRGTWADRDGTDDTVEPGDSITVEGVGAGDEVRLEWVGEDRSRLLLSETV